MGEEWREGFWLGKGEDVDRDYHTAPLFHAAVKQTVLHELWEQRELTKKLRTDRFLVTEQDRPSPLTPSED